MTRAILVSPAADRRLARAEAWLVARSRHEPLRVLGATLEGPAELLRVVATKRGAVFGWAISTLARTAARLARPALAADTRAVMSPLALEALAAQVVDRLSRDGALGRLQPVAGFPGLPRAVARTLAELRMAAIDPETMGSSATLGSIADAYEAELRSSGLVDRALLLALAAAAARKPDAPRSPLMFLDVSIATGLERDLCAALAARSVDVLALVPEGDERTIESLRDALGVAPERAAPGSTGSLRRLQSDLFSGEASREPEPGAEVVLLSAPGESRECIEIARLAQRAAADGVPFDRMAILLRAPAQYRAHVEEALRRADVPAHFARGSVEPDPAGRAFAALLACASERLSASRFAEYVSLGQVPDAREDGAPPAPWPPGDLYVAPDVEAVPGLHDAPLPGPLRPKPTSRSLPAPRRWEHLLVESAVIGGLDRWEARLGAFEKRLEAEASDASDEPRSRRATRDLDDLRALRSFAMPLLETLAALPASALWSAWLEQLGALASCALRDPARVLSLLAELHPMAEVGPIDLAGVRLVLDRRLMDLVVLPEERPAGAVFVAPVDAARGLAFDVVFVPGLAERLFPQKVGEDPILRDRERLALRAGLDTNEDRVAAERLALRLAVGAARTRLYLSYPRVDLEQSRPRVPSFYGLEVLRAAEGELPGFDALARRAEAVGSARIGWPAPSAPDLAVDEAEYDLALLEGVFRRPEAESAGTARYLLSANVHLARALRFRARRWTVRKWMPADGLVDPTGRARAALDRHLLSARSYAATALEKFAACPYRFVLYAVHELSPRETPRAIDELDRRQRGSLVHQALHALGVALEKEGLLPLTEGKLDAARIVLDRKIDEVAARARDDLAPAIPRVWDDGIRALRADLGEWLRESAKDEVWRPWRFELSFGGRRHRVSVDDASDNASDEPVALDGGLHLAGSIDLVERSPVGTLRATDYKTGQARKVDDGAIVGGGEVLQPVLYAAALEKLFPEMPVDAGRLYFCTSGGGFEDVTIPFDDSARAALLRVTSTIRDALTEGFFPAAPAPEACAHCDYRVVCGPYEESRATKKSADRLVPLRAVRALP